MSSSPISSAHPLPIPLEESDIPVGTPLDLRIVDADGRLLLDRGAVLPGVLDRTALYRFFRPHRDARVPRGAAAAGGPDYGEATGAGEVSSETEDEGGTGASIGSPASKAAAAGTSTASPASADRGVSREEMRLTIDTRLGVRLPLGAGKSTYASRVLGIAPHGAMFIAPPILGRERLVVTPGEQVELVAVGARALFLFPSTVEAVCVRPFPYLILSAPGFIRRVRERRAVRVPTRLAVLFRSEADVEGLGVALDINMLGISLFTDIPLAKVGDRVQLTFYIAQEPSTNIDAQWAASASTSTSTSTGMAAAVSSNGEPQPEVASRIEIASVIRSMTRARLPDEVGTTTQYGVEFVDLRPDVRRALRAFVLDCRLAELGQRD